MLAAGKYLAVILEYGVSLTRGEKHQATVTFGVIVDAKEQAISWNGVFSGGATEITLKSLATMGLVDATRLGDLAQGKKGGTLDIERQYEIEVEHSTFTFEDDKTKQMKTSTKARVKFINNVGGSSFQKAVAPDDFRAFIAMEGIQQKMAQANPGAQNSQPAPVSVDDIPF